jgi:predicted ATPase
MSATRFAKIELRNWRNFTRADLDLADRVFVVGPNASGKSNFLDAFRFLRDLVVRGGGLEQAIHNRDGMSKVRSLYARRVPEVSVAVEVANGNSGWRYELAFTNRSGTSEEPRVVREIVEKFGPDGRIRIRTRPTDDDAADDQLLSQTHIEQIAQNGAFRELAEFFGTISYLHLVPHLVREGQVKPLSTIGADPFGRDLLDQIRATHHKVREKRLKHIQEVLEIVAAPLTELRFEEDAVGRPHLSAKFRHWRPRGAYHNEGQFSDGTLRLIGFLWALQEDRGPLLLEEPELSLQASLVRQLAGFIHRAQRAGGGRQVILSTHSDDLLADEGIAPEEIVLIETSEEGSQARVGATIPDVTNLMRAGLTPAEVVMPRVRPKQIDLFSRVLS